MIIMKRLNKNIPYQLGGNFRRDLIENFDSLDKGYIEIIELMKKHQYEDKAAHTTNQIKHENVNLNDSINQIKKQIMNAVIGENVDSNIEVKDSKIGMDGKEYETLQERLSKEFGVINEKSQTSLDTSTQLKESFESSAFYNEVTYRRGRKFDTDYSIVHIPHKDKNGDIIKLKRGTKTDDFKNIDLTTAREYSNYKNATYVANASIFSSTPDLLGRQIVDGKIISNIEDNYTRERWSLTIGEDNTLNAYPPNITSQELLKKGVKNALTAFGPIIQNGKNVYTKGEYAANSEIDNPRTVIGQFKNKDLVFFVCDGRTKGKDTYQKGMKLDEVVDTLFAEYGDLDFAYNLDGGGSSSSILRNRMLNTPKDNKNKEDRKVADFLYISKDIQTKRDLDIQQAYQDIGELKKEINYLNGLITGLDTINYKWLFLSGFDNHTGLAIKDDNNQPRKKLYITPNNFGLYDYTTKRYDFLFRYDEGLYIDGRLMARNFTNPEPITNCNTVQRGGTYHVSRDAKGAPYPNRSSAILTHYNVTYRSFDEAVSAFQTAVPFAMSPNYKMKRRSFHKGVWSDWYDV